MATKTLNWVGQLLAGGRYQVKAKLGEGGMGFVYRARHCKLETDVVIKVPRPALLEDPEFVARFKREIRALVRLGHPHVVRIMDVDEHEGVPFAVMAYLEGGSLEDRQPIGPGRQPLPTPPEELGDWVEDVAAALDYVHKMGFVHRDVKPANILFDAQGHVYLSDFGVAKTAAETTKGQADVSLTGTGVVLGTPQYMAAEMALGAEYDGKVDQYALAATVYEMLCGRVPFQGATAAAILMKQASEQPKPVHLICDAVPKAVSDVILRGLAKDPQQRFPTCTAFAKAVLAAVAANPSRRDQERSQTSRVPVVSCPACSKTHRLPPTAWGKRIKCPACLHEFAAPAQPSTKMLRRPAEIETGKSPQAQIDTAPHKTPAGPAELAFQQPSSTPDHPSVRRGRPVLYVTGAGLLLIGLVGAVILLRGILFPPTIPDAAGDPPASHKQPELFLGYRSLTMSAGETKYMEITLERNGYEGPIELEVKDLPRRVSYSLPTVAPGRSTTQLELIAAADAREEARAARVIAKLGGLTLEESVRITVLVSGEKQRPPMEGDIASIKLLPLGELAIMRGVSKSVEVRVERKNYDGAIHLQLTGGDGSVECIPAIIPMGESRARMEIRTLSDVQVDEAQANLTATTSSGDIKDSQPIRITLLKQPKPAIAAIEPVVLTPGQSKSVEVKIDRNGWAGQVTLTFEGLPEGITCKPPILSDQESVFHLDFTCAATAPETERQTRVLCLAGTATLTAPINISIQRTGPLQVWRGPTAPILRVAYRGPDTAVSWSADKMLYVWDLTKPDANKKTLLKDIVARPVTAEYGSLTPSGRWCAVAAAAQTSSFVAGTWVYQVQLWDTEGGKDPKRRFLGSKGPQKSVTWVALNDTGGWMLCGSNDGLMRLYDANGTSVHPESLGPMPQGIEYVDFVPSNAGRAPAARQGAGNFVPGPGLPFNPPPGAGWPNALLGGGKYPPVVYGKQGGDISFWDLEKGKELGLCSGHSDRIYQVAFSPNGALAASVSRDKTVRVWDLNNFKELQRLTPNTDSPWCVAFTPDSRKLVCGGSMGTLTTWDLASKKVLRKVDFGAQAAQQAIHCVAVSPDGRRALCGAADGSVSVWSLPQ